MLAHLSVGNLSKGLDQGELVVAFELVEVGHGVVDHLLDSLAQLAVLLC